ncbi:helix-turn-helix transcriptional regulator [Hyphobacterium sp.]|uniref:helix-turn-helix transcriptional regulator n=1 Tax=Hyphobacterium sp. TaxID=2004662 RepID=UPI003749900F
MKQNPFNEPLLTTRDAANYLGVSDSCLQRHRWAGTGPVFIRLGRNGRVRYCPSDLDAWFIRCRSTRAEG